MKLKVIKQNFAICKVEDLSQVNFSDDIYFIGKTDEELSLVCSVDCIPEKAKECEQEWRAFRIEGVLDFSLIGILSRISKVLADNSIGIFVVSTFNTDYILTKSENFERAVTALQAEGYDFIENEEGEIKDDKVE
ncbi:MAG: ACT domain-containing protein [Vallitaleaceae bacterium]|nr:ACT domain-containing protein [Vallitaleaceae bacterium]